MGRFRSGVGLGLDPGYTLDVYALSKASLYDALGRERAGTYIVTI